MMLWTPHKAIFQTQKISHKNGAMEIWDIWAKMGPFWDPGDPEGTQYQVKVSGDHESNPGRPMAGSTIQYMQYKEIPCNTLFKSFETSTGPMGFVFSSWMVPYGL